MNIEDNMSIMSMRNQVGISIFHIVVDAHFSRYYWFCLSIFLLESSICLDPSAPLKNRVFVYREI